jgi:hypothetical protein
MTAVTPDAARLRLLTALRTVDDRALDRRVWDLFALAAAPAEDGALPRLLLAEDGSGAMIERMLEWGLFEGPVELALAGDGAATALARLDQWAAAHGVERTAGERAGLRLRRPGLDLAVTVAGDVRGQPAWDAVVVPDAAGVAEPMSPWQAAAAWVRPGGLLYLPLWREGGVVAEPLLDPKVDRPLEGTLLPAPGRDLVAALRAAGLEVLAAGASDRIIFAGADGRYPADEATVLRAALAGLETALSNDPAVEPGCFDAWLADRRAQVERGELIWIERRIDVLARVAP